MEFRDAEFMDAKEKERVLKYWNRFVESGFEKKNFTNSIYNHLIQHCSFIAHYDKGGFYSVYFDNKENTGRFIDQFTTGISAEYGYDLWLGGDYDDINPAMCKVMKKYAPQIREKLEADIREEDLAQARSLLAKHGIELDGDV